MIILWYVNSDLKVVPLLILFPLSSAKQQTIYPNHICVVWVLQFTGCFAPVLRGFGLHHVLPVDKDGL